MDTPQKGAKRGASAPAKKKAEPARAAPPTRSQVLRSAAAFAAKIKLDARGGVSERAFSEMERIRPGLELLVEKGLAVAQIQKWVTQQIGPGVINLTPLQRYLRAHFNYPASNPTKAP